MVGSCGFVPSQLCSILPTWQHLLWQCVVKVSEWQQLRQEAVQGKSLSLKNIIAIRLNIQKVGFHSCKESIFWSTGQMLLWSHDMQKCCATKMKRIEWHLVRHMNTQSSAKRRDRVPWALKNVFSLIDTSLRLCQQEQVLQHFQETWFYLMDSKQIANHQARSAENEAFRYLVHLIGSLKAPHLQHCPRLPQYRDAMKPHFFRWDKTSHPPVKQCGQTFRVRKHGELQPGQV